MCLTAAGSRPFMARSTGRWPAWRRVRGHSWRGLRAAGLHGSMGMVWRDVLLRVQEPFRHCAGMVLERAAEHLAIPCPLIHAGQRPVDRAMNGREPAAVKHIALEGRLLIGIQ